MTHPVRSRREACRYLDAAAHAQVLQLLGKLGAGKTPLMVLHELSTRRQLALAFDTTSPDATMVAGPFTVTATLKDKDVSYAQGVRTMRAAGCKAPPETVPSQRARAAWGAAS